MSVLGTIAELSGSFLARRLSTEAWPQLARLLREGPTLVRTPSMLPGEERLAPAVLQRARLAVLACLHTCECPCCFMNNPSTCPGKNLRMLSGGERLALARTPGLPAHM